MSKRHFQQSWSIDPNTWSISSDEDCTTLEPVTRDAALQLSSHRKNAGAVSDSELRGFAERADLLGGASSVSLGQFRGLTARYDDKGVEWQVWWLAAGSLHVYATYNGDSGCRQRDEADVALILNTLRVEFPAHAS